MLALVLSACSRETPVTAGRIAVLRFENLTPDDSLNWMGRAASEVIAREIGGGKTSVLSATTLHASPLAQSRPVSAPGESAEQSAALAEGAARLVLGQFSRVGTRLSLDVTERDPVTQKTIRNFTVTSPSAGPGAGDDLYAMADAAARRLSPRIVPFGSKNNQAIAAWARAIEETDYARLNEDYATAVQADPDFASAWLSWAGTASARGDRSASAKILADAQRHSDRFSSVDRGRLKLAAVRLTGDRAATIAAMNELGRLLPDDADNILGIAEQNFVARQFPAAAAAYRRLTQMNPRNVPAWNQLGYALAYAGDYDGAMSALQTYQRLRPNDANAIDSQGDVAFAFGRFADAEKLYDRAAVKDPSFEDSADLYKAAESRLMTGDVAGADKKFDSYATARNGAKDPSTPFRMAVWRFLSGKHDEAFGILANLVSGADAQTKTPPFKSAALTQMAVWDLQLDRRARALQELNEALKTGGASATTIIARFAAENASSPADWAARADRLLTAPQMVHLRPLALGYALYMSRQWQAAEPIWKQMVDRSGPEDTLSPVIYAHILVELNRARDAEPYVRLFPVPHPEATRDFLSLAIPEIFSTRAAVFASEGKAAEAEASRKVFRALWGGG